MAHISSIIPIWGCMVITTQTYKWYLKLKHQGTGVFKMGSNCGDTWAVIARNPRYPNTRPTQTYINPVSKIYQPYITRIIGLDLPWAC